MIVKESRIKTRSGAGALSRHVLHGAKNEAIRVLAGSDWLMRDHMREAKSEGLTYGLRHIAFNPAQAMSDTQLAEFAGRLCQELKADPSHMDPHHSPKGRNDAWASDPARMAGRSCARQSIFMDASGKGRTTGRNTTGSCSGAWQA